MELALWVLIAIVACFGFIISSRLRDISKEVAVLRRFLQKDDELKLISIPANALNVLEQLTESVLRMKRVSE